MKIGITIGDINGIGPEVIIKTLSDERVLQRITPIVYGSTKVMAYHKNIVEQSNIHFQSISHVEKATSGKINVINCWEDLPDISLGSITETGGKYAQIALEAAVKDAKAKKIDAIVTAPINKAAMQLSGFGFPGHTEYIAKEFHGESLMMMISDTLRIALVTNHLPLKDVASKITKDVITRKLSTLHNSLINDFGIQKPVIAVLGLNPHAGDEGAIGNEEEALIRPIIIDAKKRGMTVFGPYPADGFFGSSSFSKFDGILAMYHDQGLVPFKALTFGSGTNFTAGLPIIRTSPDHGTAYDIAGQNKADERSFRSALYNAMDIVRMRSDIVDMKSNALTKKIRPSDLDEEDEILEDS